MIQATTKVKTIGRDLEELGKVKNLVPKAKTCLIWFANFYKLDNNNDHTYESARKSMSNTKKMLNDVVAFDYDAVSGPQVKRIKGLELYSAAEMKKISNALAIMTELLLCAQ